MGVKKLKISAMQKRLRMKQDWTEFYKKFLDAWGYDAQSNVCIEEMSELTKALCKFARFGKDSAPQEIKDNVIEEIADVLNMAEQMAYYFGSDKVEKVRQQKIARTLNKLNNL